MTESLAETYPGRWPAALIAVGPDKCPIAKRWNDTAIERWNNGGAAENLERAQKRVAAGENIGLVIPLGMVCLDADNAEAVSMLARICPDAPMQETARGAHFLFRVSEIPSDEIDQRVALEIAPGIEVDLRVGGKGQIVVEPSVHESGALYTWKRSLPENPEDIPELPTRLRVKLPLRSKPAPPNGGAPVEDAIPEGRRDATLASLAGTMRRRGMSEDAIAGALLAENAKRCRPPLPDSQVEKIAWSVSRYAPDPSASSPTTAPPSVASTRRKAATPADVADLMVKEPFTDRGRGRRIAALYRDRMAWVPERGRWSVYDGARWVEGRDEEAMRLAFAVSDAMLDLRDRVPDGDREKYLKEAARWQSVPVATRALEAARADLLVSASEFDKSPHLLNCPNGTLDLCTEVPTLRKHDPADRLTRMTAAVYRPGARSDLWERVINTALPDEETRRYLQKVAGITLDGENGGERILILIHGKTSTAKGTVQDAIATCLGDYARTSQLNAFARARYVNPNSASPQIAHLPGRRMVNVYESTADVAIDSTLIKTLTGRDEVTARHVYGRDEIHFLPQFVIWVASNYRPLVPDDDDALWTRLREIPFAAQIKNPDKAIRPMLRESEPHGAAILAWCVEGLILWRKEGLATPQNVLDATRAYRGDMDALVEFADLHLGFGDPDVYRATPQAVRGALDTWLRATGGDRVSGKELKAWLEGKGCRLARDGNEGPRRWRGVGVTHEDDQ